MISECFCWDPRAADENRSDVRYTAAELRTPKPFISPSGDGSGNAGNREHLETLQGVEQTAISKSPRNTGATDNAGHPMVPFQEMSMCFCRLLRKRNEDMEFRQKEFNCCCKSGRCFGVGCYENRNYQVRPGL